ncbi:hypothetical protein [Sphingorhabdus sp. SMR4y]|uniref:hypothetical protein n=1 Tax=Sphingorhabdus sp. SMR4y TaxID=2584094 RepID=UPI000B5C4F6F|nr:hypothetical protein [Sphingorhabdus sp. SMR4y]ASK88254.1 hypothetical protein SPHFLASMR4Y_01505 [Sphingorhabdus sp. SMR4y]
MKMQSSTTKEKAEAYDGVASAFLHMHKELKALGMKKPADTLSESKVKFINRILEDIKSFTHDEPESKYLDLLDDEVLPQYSDAILVMSQYEGVLSAFHNRYHGWDGKEHRWFVS